MDVFFRYNQICMAPKDEEKTVFITDRDLFYYKMIPFELKNAGTTYQRLVNKMFKEQIKRNIEVYMDDMLINSEVTLDHIADL